MCVKNAIDSEWLALGVGVGHDEVSDLRSLCQLVVKPPAGIFIQVAAITV